MSDTSGELPIPFAAFARSLGPQTTTAVPAMRPGQTARMHVAPGHPDEVYLRLLRIRHGAEARTHTQWMALIDKLRKAPAHPADPNYVPGA